MTQAEFDFILAIRCQPPPGRGDDGLALVGVQQADPGIDVRRKVAGLEVQHPEIAGAVSALPGLKVPVPDAIPSGVHGQPEALLAVA